MWLLDTMTDIAEPYWNASQPWEGLHQLTAPGWGGEACGRTVAGGSGRWAAASCSDAHRPACYTPESLDDCVPNPCQNGGTCKKKNESTLDIGWQCECKKGYMGVYCQDIRDSGDTSCSILKNITHGSVKMSHKVSRTGTVATFSCRAANYALYGAATLTCQPDFQWSHDPPHCLQVCDEGWAVYDDRCIGVTRAFGWYNETAGFCRDMGAELATPKTPQESRIITQVAGHLTVWIGLRSHTAPQAAQGATPTWVWGDGSRLDHWVNWADSSQAKNGGCVKMKTDTALGAWLAAPCARGLELRAACQKTRDMCNPNPCLNGGTCKKEIHSHIRKQVWWCECKPRYKGSHCQNERGNRDRSCSKLRDITNGSVTMSDKYRWPGTTAHFACHFPNYFLYGAASATCRHDHTWSAPPPVCLKVCDDGWTVWAGRCIKIDKVVSGNFDQCKAVVKRIGATLVTPKSPEDARSLAKLTDYRPIWIGLYKTWRRQHARHMASAWKWIDGTNLWEDWRRREDNWVNWAARRPASDWDDYKHVLNCSMTRRGSSQGAWLDVLCNQTHRCVGEKSRNKFCPDLEDIPRGAVTYSANNVGVTAAYRCHMDHFLVGNETRTCRQDGTWSGEAPTCTPFCDDYWTISGDKCVRLTKKKHTWDEGLQACRALGGGMAIMAEPEEDEMTKLLNALSHYNSVWIGLKQEVKIKSRWPLKLKVRWLYASRGRDSAAEVTYVRRSGGPWAEGRPLTPAGADEPPRCATAAGWQWDHAEWVDQKCNETFEVACQKPQNPIPAPKDVKLVVTPHGAVALGAPVLMACMMKGSTKFKIFQGPLSNNKVVFSSYRDFFEFGYWRVEAATREMSGWYRCWTQFQGKWYESKEVELKIHDDGSRVPVLAATPPGPELRYYTKVQLTCALDGADQYWLRRGGDVILEGPTGRAGAFHLTESTAGHYSCEARINGKVKKANELDLIVVDGYEYNIVRSGKHHPKTSPISYYDAYKLCESEGGSLPMPRHPEANERLNQLTKHGRRFYLGLTFQRSDDYLDADGNFQTPREEVKNPKGTWTWNDGVPLSDTWTNWYRGKEDVSLSGVHFGKQPSFDDDKKFNSGNFLTDGRVCSYMLAQFGAREHLTHCRPWDGDRDVPHVHYDVCLHHNVFGNVTGRWGDADCDAGDAGVTTVVCQVPTPLRTLPAPRTPPPPARPALTLTPDPGGPVVKAGTKVTVTCSFAGAVEVKVYKGERRPENLYYHGMHEAFTIPEVTPSMSGSFSCTARVSGRGWSEPSNEVLVLVH